jgi:SPX domain protein involved in polyphosphate accumulation
MTRIKSILSGALETDIHNGTYGYIVRSLYFDSFNDTDYYAKLASEEARKKIRLRTYDPDSPVLQLELKSKINANQKKTTYPIKRSDAGRLVECDYEVLSGRPEAAEIYNIMKLNRVRPVVMVQYRRFAFIHPSCNVRITLDSEIKSTESDFNIFNRDVVLTPVDVMEAGVMEIKYEGFFPAWIGQILSEVVTERTDNSKYTNSRNIFTRYIA